MKKSIVFFYGLLILILSCQAIYTVYKLGGTIGQGEKLSRLEQEQQSLASQLQILREEHSSATALTTLASETDTTYQPIRQPIIISVTDNVALR
jgi:hypothetical protein